MLRKRGGTDVYTQVTLKELEKDCAGCSKCPLGQTKINSVFGAGSPDAVLMFIGEAPGAQEDEQGVPFVGAAGKLFDKYLNAVDIDRSEVYIANMLKCRPPKNRDPLPEEKEACYPYLREQIKIIKPKMIVCLGRISAQRFIREDFKITRDHGVWEQKGEFLMTAVYHPSLLLRDPRRREEMLKDMISVKEKYDEFLKQRS